jgi:hypothetical protein
VTFTVTEPELDGVQSADEPEELQPLGSPDHE